MEQKMFYYKQELEKAKANHLKATMSLKIATTYINKCIAWRYMITWKAVVDKLDKNISTFPSKIKKLKDKIRLKDYDELI